MMYDRAEQQKPQRHGYPNPDGYSKHAPQLVRFGLWTLGEKSIGSVDQIQIERSCVALHTPNLGPRGFHG